MPKDISIKELRANLADIADQVEKGASFRVIRRSKPAFIVMKVDAEDEGEWETIIDFTEGGNTKGAPIEDVLNALRKMRR